MGWDGYAKTADGKNPPKNVLAKFRRAAKAVQRRAGTCDGLLEVAALDCSACAYALEKMGLDDAWVDHSARDIVKTWERAKAIEPTGEYATSYKWAWESAREFLRLSAENNLAFEACY